MEPTTEDMQAIKDQLEVDLRKVLAHWRACWSSKHYVRIANWYNSECQALIDGLKLMDFNTWEEENEA